LLDRDVNNGQIIFNNESTAGFDNTRNLALNMYFLSVTSYASILNLIVGFGTVSAQFQVKIRLLKVLLDAEILHCLIAI
jgi:hypothetical protein